MGPLCTVKYMTDTGTHYTPELTSPESGRVVARAYQEAGLSAEVVTTESAVADLRKRGLQLRRNQAR